MGQDISFGVFGNEDGKAEFAMQVEKDAKGMTLTPDKRSVITAQRILCHPRRLIEGRPQHALHEGREPRPLFWNPVLTHLAMFVGKGAFQDYETMEDLLDLEPLEKEMSRLEWDPSVLDTPLYRRKDGGIESAGVFGRRCRALGLRAGYERPPVIHDFRAEGLHTIGNSPVHPSSRASIRLTRTQTSSTHRLQGCNMADTPAIGRTVNSMRLEIPERTVKTATSATSHGPLLMICSAA